jgi:signal transduction histidine kinase
MEQTFLDGKVHSSEELVFSPEGYPISIIVQTSPLFDEQNNVVAVVEMGVDITENKRLQRKLEESIEKYRMLFNEVPCFISVQDKNFKIIDTNKRFKNEFGEGWGRFCYEVYKHRATRCEICPVAETFADGNIHVSEEIVAGKNGNPINVLVYAAPIKNEQDEIVAVMEMSTDITNLKKMQSEMANLGQLVSGLAHTIKGIVTGLEGGIYVVESGFKNKNDESIKRGWEMVQRNVQRISQLVLDMLYYAKSRIPEVKEVEIATICEEVFELYQKKFSENNIEPILEINYRGTLKGDAKAIYTMILNLVENAIHACVWDTEKPKHQIKVCLNGFEERVVLSVCDNGIGMSDEVKAKLFTPLFSTKGSSGSGFGLMVVKKIVEEHNGTIYVETVESCGSKFVVEFPLSFNSMPV